MTRTGIGYDVHKLVKGQNLIIGGISIPSDFGSIGHSDGDGLIHAIVDAILGAANLGDIGTHFPSSDKTWENYSSGYFLTYSVDLIKKSRFKINNIDSTVILHTPKIIKFIPKIIENLSLLTHIDKSKISIKATTTDGLGFVGKGQGWSVLALVTLSENSR